MTSYLPIIAAFGIGLVANIIIRKANSRATKLLIGIPSVILMLLLVLIWLR